MCLYPRFFKNPKYQPNKKNGHKPQRPSCPEVEYVPVGCGKCIECRKQKANAWRIRLHEEIKQHKHKYFTTFTISNEEGAKLVKKYNPTCDNDLATKAVRLFLERWRKKYKISLTHWFVTELGQENTERIHLHGVIFSETKLDNEEISQMWSYGYTDLGQYCNAKSINYIVKYIHKVDQLHKKYIPIVLTSAGIGRSYLNEGTYYKHRYRPHETREYYMLPNGTKVNLPIYYRNNIYSEEQREKLWIEKVHRHIRYVRGIEIRNVDTPEGYKRYCAVLKQQQAENKFLGYGDLSDEWKAEPYKETIKLLNNIK